MTATTTTFDLKNLITTFIQAFEDIASGDVDRIDNGIHCSKVLTMI
ncbi:hypothetical protein [Citrobacter braakii]